MGGGGATAGWVGARGREDESEGRGVLTSCMTAVVRHRLLHLYYVGAEHVGFSPTRQTGGRVNIWLNIWRHP